jgi:hypothetical protein
MALSVAPFVVTFVAGSIVTVGSAMAVVNDVLVDVVAPAEFVATYTR